MKIKIRKSVWNIKQNYRVNHFFLLNSTNVPLLLSTISDIYAKLENETELISFNTSLISE